MRYSIITVCLNAGSDLISSIKSVLNQTFDDFEIIVQDGGSTDGSVESLPKDRRIKVFSEKDSGIYDAMNKALEHAKGEYYLFLNAGDLFYNADLLNNIDQRIGNNAVCYGLCFNRKMKHTNVYPKSLSRFTCFRTMVCHQSMVYHKSVFKNKKYDLSYKILADHDLLCRIVCEMRIKPKYLDFVVVDYKADGVCENAEYKKSNKRELASIRKKYFGLPERIWYSFILFFTFKWLRQKIASGRFSKAYYRFVKFIYNLKK